MAEEETYHRVKAEEAEGKVMIRSLIVGSRLEKNQIIVELDCDTTEEFDRILDRVRSSLTQCLTL